MRTKLFTLFSSLLLWATMMMAAPIQSLVPAMIVHGMDGNKQVVQLDAIDVTDLVVLQTSQSLSVDVPESHVSGVRSIVFAMVTPEEIGEAIDNTESPIVRSVEKVLRDGQVIIRLQTQKGSIIEYNIQGNQITTKNN